MSEFQLELAVVLAVACGLVLACAWPWITAENKRINDEHKGEDE